MRKFLLSLALVFTAVGATAQSVIVTGGPQVNAIGDEIGTQYDTFQFNSGSFVPTPGVLDITTYSFVVGPNCYVCSIPVFGNATFSIDFDTVHDTISVPFTWIGGAVDSIVFGNTIHSYDYNGLTYTLSTFGFMANGGNGDTVNETLHGFLSAAPTVTVTPVPEPETYALMLAGLGLLGFIGRRRQAK